ncbi:MAG: ACT domain-containing protein, partial [Treponema sp.]|nr:ACT domain-containing protein [Treponema sp.]
GGTRLCISNKNVSGVVSKFTSVLGEAKMNIASIVNQSRNDLAYNLIDVDHKVDDATLEALREIEGVINVRPIFG